MLKIGTSAGGARAKALIAWNEETKDIRSGQIDAGDGYSYWLLKFGEIKNNKDKDKEADTGRKIYMQSLGGVAHYDFNDPGAHSYEQAVQMMRKMGLRQNAVEQLFRRMVFNEVAKNYDDQTKEHM